MNKALTSSYKPFSLLLGVLVCACSIPIQAEESVAEVLSAKGFYANLLLRYESVEQDNSLPDADALTLRTRLGFKTKEVNNFSALVELEDSRNIFGVNDYSVPATDFNTGEFSVIADPESSEIDQLYLAYTSKMWNVKLGRQLIVLDNQRFVGDVGWRQDRQTFDGLKVEWQATEKLKLSATQLFRRNRIFADERDIDSEDTLLRVAWDTDFGKLVTYAYFLEEDDIANSSNDTIGIRLSGNRKLNELKALYTVEVATQDRGVNIDTSYLAIVGGVEFTEVTVKLGFESLGSDGGNGGFATPLATLHKFNGWADQFLTTPAEGLEDFYFSLAGTLANGKWAIIYHDFSSDIAAVDGDDLGDEIDLSYTRNFGKHFFGGAKYSDYSAGAFSFGKVDTRKLWLWAGAKF